MFDKVLDDFESELLEFNGENDHVHLLISYPPKHSISAMVNSLKGVSSRRLKEQFPEIESFWSVAKSKNSLWSPSYFASSTGGACRDGHKVSNVSKRPVALEEQPNKDYIWFLDKGIDMQYSSQIKPISYVKANAAELISQLERDRQPLVITQNGEARAVLQDIVSFEQTQETLALLKILALGNQQFANNQVEPFDDVISRIKNKHRTAE